VSSTPDWQPSLLDSTSEDVGIDGSFSSLVRVDLDAESWVDHAPGWVSGADELFAELLESTDWGQRTRLMFDKRVIEPRLTSSWRASSGEPLQPVVLEQMRRSLSEHYDVDLDSMGMNLYRDGRDSVAWHGDRIGRGDTRDTMVAIVSVGEPRPLLLRPRDSKGRTVRQPLGHGDLIVMGGSCQRTWDHAIPKTAKPVGPRISIQYRPRNVR
jgi:alkylated DNA repair dioxygenase AlkB